MHKCECKCVHWQSCECNTYAGTVWIDLCGSFSVGIDNSSGDVYRSTFTCHIIKPPKDALSRIIQGRYLNAKFSGSDFQF